MLSVQSQHYHKNTLITRIIAIMNNHISYHLGDVHKRILTTTTKNQPSVLREYFFLEILCQVFLAADAFAKFHAINNHNHLEL